jgi:flagellar hook-basal body complex protein FliE
MMKEISLTYTPPITSTRAAVPSTPAQSQGNDFQTHLKQALGEVNDLKQQADQAIRQFVGEGKGDLQETIVAMEKADISFRLMMQIRNKILEAYQEIVRMQV